AEPCELELVRANISVEFAIELAQVAEYLLATRHWIDGAIEFGNELAVLFRPLPAHPEVVCQSPAPRILFDDFVAVRRIEVALEHAPHAPPAHPKHGIGA